MDTCTLLGLLKTYMMSDSVRLPSGRNEEARREGKRWDDRSWEVSRGSSEEIRSGGRSWDEKRSFKVSSPLLWLLRSCSRSKGKSWFTEKSSGRVDWVLEKFSEALNNSLSCNGKMWKNKGLEKIRRICEITHFIILLLKVPVFNI